MDGYPEVLLSHQSNPVLSEDEVSKYNFVRETQEDIYIFLGQGLSSKDIISKIIAPQLSEREVFEFSVFLYGYYDKSCIGIRVLDDSLYNFWTDDMPAISCSSICYTRSLFFPLFLCADKLYQKQIDLEDIDGQSTHYLLSFSHKPTRINYWHFQLYTADGEGNDIPRSKSNRRLKLLAKHIFEQYVIKAICLESDVKKFLQ
jgi:hypothetical protein